ncbi:peptidase inhibitor family I36 protein [Streptomyces fagopyri]|uniref:peptidase inhibitor family I36 protein n=1 Tax=Streptomyces fagopyri TaxID=2662397 RepID=UPI00371A3717
MATSTAAHAASTDGSCPSGNVCLWANANYTGKRIISASTNTCVDAGIAGAFGYRSYISHLPVTAILWNNGPVRTLPAGGFSSDFGTWYTFDFICTNGHTP